MNNARFSRRPTSPAYFLGRRAETWVTVTAAQGREALTPRQRQRSGLTPDSGPGATVRP